MAHLSHISVDKKPVTSVTRIRMVKFIKKYLEGIKVEKYKYFVTLTIKNPNTDNLKGKIEQFYKFFQNSYLRKHKRFKYLSKKIKMIRSFEFTLNNLQKTYHIHLHILLAGEIREEIIEYGKLLIKYWKKYFTEEGEVSDDAQYLEEMKKGELENFKYMTKLDDINSDNIFMVYNMLKALFGRRLFMAKNIKPVKLKEDDEIKEKTEEEFEDAEHSEDELNEYTINGKKVINSFYFDYKNSNYIDEEKKIFLLSKKQIKKIPRIKREKKNLHILSKYFRDVCK